MSADDYDSRNWTAKYYRANYTYICVCLFSVVASILWPWIDSSWIHDDIPGGTLIFATMNQSFNQSCSSRRSELLTSSDISVRVSGNLSASNSSLIFFHALARLPVLVMR